MPTEVTHRGRVALAHVDQSGGRNALERLAHGRTGYPEHLGEAAFAGQCLTRLHFSAENIGNDLIEDVLGYRTPVHRLKGHAPRMTDHRPEVKWSDH